MSKKPNTKNNTEVSSTSFSNLPDQWSYTLQSEDREQTLAKVLRAHLPEGLSWKQVRRLVHTGKVFLDGQRLNDPAWRPQHGTQLELKMSAPRNLHMGELQTSRVLWIDVHLVVIDKPSGLLSYAFESQAEEPCAELYTRGAIQQLRKGNMKDPLFLVHVLDKGCSGAMLFARNRNVQKQLQRQFEQRDTQRVFQAIVHGHPKTGRLHSWMVDDRGDGYRGSVSEPNHRPRYAKEALTHVLEVERLTKAAIVTCQPETQRTHQVRIHLSEQKHPIFGDHVYLKAQKFAIPTQTPTISRLALHSSKIS
ncbi:MAG: RluA family pseudouridine synthase, partial [Myxococcota bacterium]